MKVFLYPAHFTQVYPIRDAVRSMHNSTQITFRFFSFSRLFPLAFRHLATFCFHREARLSLLLGGSVASFSHPLSAHPLPSSSAYLGYCFPLFRIAAIFRKLAKIRGRLLFAHPSFFLLFSPVLFCPLSTASIRAEPPLKETSSAQKTISSEADVTRSKKGIRARAT